MSRHRSARRITSLAGLLCLWPSGPAGAGDRPSAASGRADAEEAIVQVVTIRRADGARQPRGSAFYIDADGHLLTCAHVLDQMPNDESPRLR
ncbi:MAG TPA: hypothetical protein VMR21_10525, partial [Vicinamibacteria bacterium]|nr:hypothetical protein [Vicinamibacteria bacterium]